MFSCVPNELSHIQTFNDIGTKLSTCQMCFLLVAQPKAKILKYRTVKQNEMKKQIRKYPDSLLLYISLHIAGHATW